MFEREQDLENLKAEVQNLRLASYKFCRFIADLPDSNVRLAGYETKEQAFLTVMKRTEDAIERLYQEFDKKYPD
jgi:hypothetical protein